MFFLKAHIINPLLGLLLTGLILIQFFTPVPYYFYFLVGFIWLAINSLGSFNILLNYYIEALHFQAKPMDMHVALTFDDGPHPTNTKIILDLLKKYNAKATFFCIGKQIAKHPEITARIIAEGHTIGNHSYNHSNNFGFLKPAAILEELRKTDQLIESMTGRKNQLFRPPFGVTNPFIKKALQQSGHITIGWSNRSLDTVLKPKSRVVNRIINRLKAGDIVLLHDTISQTTDVLEEVLLFLERNKYQAVSVDSLLKIEAYA